MPNEFVTKAFADSTYAGTGSGISQTNADARYIKLDGTSLPSANLSMNSKKIVSVADPTSAQDVSTKGYTDTQVATKQSQTQADARYLQLTGGTVSGAIDMGANKITSTYVPVNSSDLCNKTYVDSKVSSAGSGSSISTSAGYAIVTSASNIQHQKSGTTYLTETQANSFYEQDLGNGVTIRNFGLYDNSSVNYTHAKYLLTNSTTRPHFAIHDIGSEASQCNRLSSY